MMIACNECRQRLSDALDETANTEARGALTEHLATCDSCRNELRILQAAREELRTFPVLTAPTDLRARVRTAIEAEPVAAPIGVKEAEVSDPFTSTKTVLAPAGIGNSLSTPRSAVSANQPNRLATWRDSFRAFLRNPTSITWASCCVLLLFYFVSLSRPSKPSGEFEGMESRTKDELADKFPDDNKADAPTYQAPSHYDPYFKPIPKIPVPKKVPAWASPSPPGNAFPEPSTKSSQQTPNAKSNASAKGNGASTPKNRPQAEAPSGSAASSPKANTDSSQASDSGSSSNEAPREREAAPSAVSPAPPSPVTAPVTQKSQDSYMARSTPDSAVADKDDRAQESDAASKPAATREIRTRLTPPRSVGWSQISVVLSGGARFADGQKSRVIWRGAAQANEPIELRFSIQNAEDGDAKITLQEVKNGQTQVIAYKTVPLKAAR